MKPTKIGHILLAMAFIGYAGYQAALKHQDSVLQEALSNMTPEAKQSYLRQLCLSGVLPGKGNSACGQSKRLEPSDSLPCLPSSANDQYMYSPEAFQNADFCVPDGEVLMLMTLSDSENWTASNPWNQLSGAARRIAFATTTPDAIKTDVHIQTDKNSYFFTLVNDEK